MACTGNKNSYFSEEEKEDSNAKEMGFGWTMKRRAR